MYNLEGNRGGKNSASGTNTGGGPPDPSGYDDFLHDLHGRVTQTLAPDSGAGWTGEAYAASRHIAHYNGQETIIHSDWLGTERSRDNVTYDTHQLYNQTETSALRQLGRARHHPRLGHGLHRPMERLRVQPPLLPRPLLRPYPRPLHVSRSR